MPMFDAPEATEELFGIQKSIYEKLTSVLGHPAISPTKGVGEGITGMVMPPTKEAATQSAVMV